MIFAFFIRLIFKLFERETRREKILESKLRELRLKNKQVVGGGGGKPLEEGDESVENIIKETEEAIVTLERQYKKEMNKERFIRNPELKRNKKKGKKGGGSSEKIGSDESDDDDDDFEDEEEEEE